ncbi:hypothetical protein GCM10008955_39940 [Deinococcus malanensis]|uniref:Uncharacterized protein n=2 Tax=Deinococcus malanensis TaxID=1706855 RepID=A0ABQ2F5L8_9DEIO|nr:hypothetical protein GCM10008955_39940 [Deinococcus malanensis]
MSSFISTLLGMLLTWTGVTNAGGSGRPLFPAETIRPQQVGPYPLQFTIDARRQGANIIFTTTFKHVGAKRLKLTLGPTPDSNVLVYDNQGGPVWSCLDSILLMSQRFVLDPGSAPDTSGN